MRGKLRAVLLAAVGAATLVWSGSALAAYTPQFIVNHNPHRVASPTTQISIRVPREDDATAKVTFYAPPGFQGVLGQAAGTQVGTVAATIQALRISPDIVVPVNGTILTDDPARYTANPCAPGAHRAVWVLRLEAQGQTLMVPVYIDVPTGPESAFSSFKFQACLPSPHIPPEQGGATLGAKLLTAQLQLQSGILTSPATSGRYVWPALFTPYPAGSGVPNAAGTVQSRAIVAIPGQVRIAARWIARTNRWRVSGAVTEFGAGISRATVDILKGVRSNRLRRAARVRSRGNGRYSASGRLRPQRRTFFRARAVVPDRLNSARGCSIAVTGLPTVPGGCVSAVYSGFTVQSRLVSVTPRRR